VHYAVDIISLCAGKNHCTADSFGLAIHAQGFGVDQTTLKTSRHFGKRQFSLQLIVSPVLVDIVTHWKDILRNRRFSISQSKDVKFSPLNTQFSLLKPGCTAQLALCL